MKPMPFADSLTKLLYAVSCTQRVLRYSDVADRVLKPSTVYFEVVQRPGAPLWPPIVPLGLREAGRCTPDISEVDEVTQNLSYPVSSVIKREKLRFRQRLPRSNLPTSATIDLVVS